MPGEVLDAGLTTGLVVAIVGGLVQLLVWRIRTKTAERLKTIDTSSVRDSRALDAEDKAFGYLQKALDDARKENDSLEAAIAAIRRAHDAEMGALKLDLAREEKHKNEAIADAANVKNMWQGAQAKLDAERAAIHKDLEAAHWRERLAAAWIRQARVVAPDLPPAPYWIDDDAPAPPQLPPGRED